MLSETGTARRGSRLLAALVMLAMLASGALAQEAEAAKRRRRLPTRMLACDTTLGPDTKSFRLGNNLDCTDPGLLIQGASDLTVDLGGHRMSGVSTENGLRVFGANRVTIRNGVIDGFDFNVIVGSSNRITLQNLIVTSGNQRVAIQDGVGHRIVGNTFIDEGSLSIEDQGGTVDPKGIVVSGNTFVNTRLFAGGPGPAAVDDSTFSSNRFFGGGPAGIELGDGSERNAVVGNTVIGTGDRGILVTGNGADDNSIRGNIVRGHFSGAGTGINVVDADGTAVVSNRSTGNRFGIAATGSTEDIVISTNNASANLDTGILYGGVASAQVSSNTVNENGIFGIDVFFGVAAEVRDNTVNFTGYLNGVHDASGTGIRAQSASGSGNRVQGSDVTDCTSADTDLCVIGPATPPPLIGCDVQVTAAATLHHPMVCSNVAAVDINGNGFTVDLGEHVIDAGAAGAEDGALHLSPGTHHVTVRGGLMTGSTNGINFLSPGSDGPHDVTISGALVVGNVDTGIWIQGVDLVPDGDTVTAGRNRIERSTIVGTLLNVGLRVHDAPLNTVAGNTIVGNSVGLEIARSARNTASSNEVIGGNTSISLSNAATDQLAAQNALTGNKLTGPLNRGVDMQDAVLSTLRSNRLLGAGSVGVRSIAGGVLGGGQDNVLSGNVITGGGGNGISLGADERNAQLIKNVTSANHGAGIEVLSEAEGTLIRENTASENGADDPSVAGIIVANPAGAEERDVLIANVAKRNGFLSEATGDGIGLGIDAASDTSSRDNVARGNDNPAQCADLSCS